MIKVVSRKNISDQNWNACVQKAHNEAIYGYTWYLDHIAPNWMGIVVGDYKAVFPLIYKKKYGFSYLCQTSFYQRNAIYSKSELNAKLLQSVFESIPRKMVLWDFCMDTHSTPKKWLISASEKQNMVLDLNLPYDQIYASYNKNTKRNIKAAAKNELTTRVLMEPKIAIETYKTNNGSKQGYGLSDLDAKNIKAFMDFSIKTKKATLLAAYKDNQFLGSVLFAFSASKVYYLFSSVNEEGRENKALFFIVDQFIKTHSNNKLALDFEGSMNKGVARFYAGFGSKIENYYHFKQGLWNRFFTLA